MANAAGTAAASLPAWEPAAAPMQQAAPMQAASAPEASARYMALSFPQRPQPLYTMYEEYAKHAAQCKHSNFLKGCLWSPDGACLLTASDDNWLRVYDLPQDALDAPATAATAADEPCASPRTLGSFQQCHAHASGGGGLGDSLPVGLRVHEGETVYDAEWFPCMTTAEPATCCFASTSRAHPIHLWDACTGALRCTYRGYNDVDEVTAAFSLAFSPDGTRLLAGYNKKALVFDVSRPGRDYAAAVRTYAKARRDESLPGMVSAAAFSDGAGAGGGGSVAALGSYGGGIALYDTRTWEMLFLLKGHRGGITQLRFTGGGCFLLSGARQDGDLICWDLRGGAASELYRLPRNTATTNQRVGFSVEPCGRHVATGGCDGAVRVFDLQTGQSADSRRVASDTVNGCDFHPCLNLLAVATGHRRYPITSCRMDSDDSDTERPGRKRARASHASVGDGGDSAVVRGGGVENTVRVFRLDYSLLNLSELAGEGQEHEDGALTDAG